MTTFVDIAPTVAKLVRLLASDNAGEVTAAAHALRRVLNSAGLDLHDLSNIINSRAFRRISQISPTPAGDDNVLEMIRCCYRHTGCLGTKELTILHSIAARCREPTRHQMNMLRPLYKRCLELERRT